MLASLFLIGVFVLAFRSFAPQPACTTAAGIPCVIVAGLFGMNFFEPAARAMVKSSGVFAFLRPDVDCLCFLAMFLGVLAALQKLVTSFPDPPRLPEIIEFRACLLLTVTASYLVMSIVLTGCDTSPRLQRLLGLSPDSAALLGIVAPDAQWLSFVGLVADGSLSRPNHTFLRSIATDPQSVGQSAGDSAGKYLRTFRRRFVEYPATAIAVVDNKKSGEEPPIKEQPQDNMAVESEPVPVVVPEDVPVLPKPRRQTNAVGF